MISLYEYFLTKLLKRHLNKPHKGAFKKTFKKTFKKDILIKPHKRSFNKDI